MDVKLSLSIEFLKAFSHIPPAQQNGVQDFVRRFQANPKAPGINYEKIHTASDKSLRSVRINDKYRAIISHPDNSDVYVLLWVDKHDDAYAWAQRRQLSINPRNGALQIVDVKQPDAVRQVEAAPQIVKPKAEVVPGLFDSYSDEQLFQLGVPEELLSQVRAIKSDEQLDNESSVLPVGAYSGLLALACGYSFDDALIEASVDNPDKVDTTDFWAALNNDNSKSQFTIIKDAIELEQWLNAPLELWRVFLHPLQRKLVQWDVKGSICVRGTAGTGKTVVVIHRAKWLVEHKFTNPKDRILVTTYTTTLATDIRESLRKICTDEQFERIDVINLDKWTQDYLNKNGYHGKLILDAQKKDLWGQAMASAPSNPTENLTEQFYKDEWEQVIQPQSVFTEEDYFRVSRKGRGRSLSRKTRKAVWPVFEEYRALLNESNLKESEDFYRDGRCVLQENKSVPLQYKAIIVDEAQDFSFLALSLIRAMVPEGDNDLFIVGDSHQRIYGQQTSLGSAGIRVQGRSRKLHINYRTTEETRQYADQVLTGDYDNLDGEKELLDRCRSLTRGNKPRIQTFANKEEHDKRLIELIRNLTAQDVKDSEICIACRTNDLCSDYYQLLKNANVKPYHLKNDIHEESEDGIRIATMHRIKGIEFDYVILVCANDNVIPPPSVVSQQDNPIDEEAKMQQERSLLYVTLTRARKAVYVLSYETLCRLLPSVNE